MVCVRKQYINYVEYRTKLWKESKMFIINIYVDVYIDSMLYCLCLYVLVTLLLVHLRSALVSSF